MEVALLAAPPGFNVACSSLSAACTGAAKAVVATLAKDVLAADHGASTGMNLQALQQEFSAAAFTTTTEQVQQWVSAISFIRATALKHDVAAEELFAQLQENTELGTSASKVVARQYALQQREADAASAEGAEAGSAAPIMSTGRLVDTQWSVGITMGNSLREKNTVDMPQTPLVSLNLALCSASGEVKRTPLTMTVPEFRELHKQLKDAASAMEGL